MVLNSLKIDPDRVWKGPWRWFSEDMLDCCVPLETVKKRGITLDEFACLARCNGSLCKVIREGGEDHFRETVKSVCSSSEMRLVTAYDRQVLKQTGSGHFSPIAGYHSQSDHDSSIHHTGTSTRSPLVCSVPAHKSISYCRVPLSLLYQAMQSIDPDSGKPRGYVIMRRAQRSSLGKLFKINTTGISWHIIARGFFDALQQKCADNIPENITEFAELCIRSLSATVLSSLSLYVDNYDNLHPEHRKYVDNLFTAIRETKMYRLLADAVRTIQQKEQRHNTTPNKTQSCLSTESSDENTPSGTPASSNQACIQHTPCCANNNLTNGSTFTGTQSPDIISALSGFGRLELATVFMLAHPLRNCRLLSSSLRSSIESYSALENVPEALQAEIEILRDSLEELAKTCCIQPTIEGECMC